MQAGLQLVQLCALLLDDTAAGAAVAAQLTANAAAFSADAVEFVAQGQLDAVIALQPAPIVAASSGEAGLMLQQLMAAQQYLKALLAQALQQQ
jgi:hypothetical protein